MCSDFSLNSTAEQCLVCSSTAATELLLFVAVVYLILTDPLANRIQPRVTI